MSYMGSLAGRELVNYLVAQIMAFRAKFNTDPDVICLGGEEYVELFRTTIGYGIPTNGKDSKFYGIRVETVVAEHHISLGVVPVSGVGKEYGTLVPGKAEEHNQRRHCGIF